MILDLWYWKILSLIIRVLLGLIPIIRRRIKRITKRYLNKVTLKTRSHAGDDPSARRQWLLIYQCSSIKQANRGDLFMRLMVAHFRRVRYWLLMQLKENHTRVRSICQAQGTYRLPTITYHFTRAGEGAVSDHHVRRVRVFRLSVR